MTTIYSAELGYEVIDDTWQNIKDDCSIPVALIEGEHDPDSLSSISNAISEIYCPWCRRDVMESGHDDECPNDGLVII